MFKKKTVSVIMPCYNEGNRVLNVLNEVKKSKLVSEVIIIDDGSNTETKKVLSKISGVKLITHKKNLGKSEAMKTGVLEARSDVTMFIDCDLSGFKESYISGLAKPVIDGELDLVLGDYEYEFWFFKMSGLSLVLSGQRVVRRDLLLKNLDVFTKGGFWAEIEMNKIFFKKNRVGRFFLKGVGQVFKFQKYGLIGLISDFKFLFKLIKHVGLRELKKQVIFIREAQKINY